MPWPVGKYPQASIRELGSILEGVIVGRISVGRSYNNARHEEHDCGKECSGSLNHCEINTGSRPLERWCASVNSVRDLYTRHHADQIRFRGCGHPRFLRCARYPHPRSLAVRREGDSLRTQGVAEAGPCSRWEHNLPPDRSEAGPIRGA